MEYIINGIINNLAFKACLIEAHIVPSRVLSAPRSQHQSKMIRLGSIQPAYFNLRYSGVYSLKKVAKHNKRQQHCHRAIATCWQVMVKYRNSPIIPKITNLMDSHGSIDSIYKGLFYWYIM